LEVIAIILQIGSLEAPCPFSRFSFLLKRESVERIALDSESNLCHFHTNCSLCQDSFGFLFCPPKSWQISPARYHHWIL